MSTLACAISLPSGNIASLSGQYGERSDRVSTLGLSRDRKDETCRQLPVLTSG